MKSSDLRDCLPTDSLIRSLYGKADELDAVLVSLNGDFADITAYPPTDHRGIIALQVRNRPETVTPIMQRLVSYLDQHSDRGLWMASCCWSRHIGFGCERDWLRR